MGSQDIGIPRGSIVPHKFRNAHPLKTSINPFPPKHGHPTPIFSKVIVRKTVTNKGVDFNSFCEMDFGCNSVVTESPNFMNFGRLPANTLDKIKSGIAPTTRVGGLTNGSGLGMILRKLHMIE